MSQQAKVKKIKKKKRPQGYKEPGTWSQGAATHSTGSSNVRMLLLSSLSLVQS